MLMPDKLDAVLADLDANGIARRVLMVDELPPEWTLPPRYEVDLLACPRVIMADGSVSGYFTDMEELSVPIVVFRAMPEPPDYDALRRLEDSRLIQMMGESIPTSHRWLLPDPPSRDEVSNLFEHIEDKHHTIVAFVLCNDGLRDIMMGWDWMSDDDRKPISTRVMWTATVIFSDQVPEMTMYLLPPAEYLGAMPTLPKGIRGSRGGVMERVGMAVINGHLTGSIRFGDDTPQEEVAADG